MKTLNFSPDKVTYLQANSGRISIDRVITRYPTYIDVSVDNPYSRPRELSV
jgi:hypothetical protein